MISMRPAMAADVPLLCELDRVARGEHQRRQTIQQAVEAGHCTVAEKAGRVVGYAILEYTFYSYGFVSLLYVDAAWRRQGVGTALLAHLEAVCRTPKLFTSTNLSNLPMQDLLARRQFILSGVIHHLDEDDPELVYVKYVG